MKTRFCIFLLILSAFPAFSQDRLVPVDPDNHSELYSPDKKELVLRVARRNIWYSKGRRCPSGCPPGEWYGKAERHEFMTMADWTSHLDNVLSMNGEQILIGSGSVSHDQAVDKATEEYKKYQQRTLSEVEKAYLDTIKMLEDKSKE